MTKRKPTIKAGFTIVELMVSILLTVLVIAGIGIVLADSQRGWNAMYDKTYSDVMTDSYVARKTFDTVIRNASRKNYLLDINGNWLEVYYYADVNSTDLDRYARFSYAPDSGDQLNLERGILDPKQTLTTSTVCKNVSNCIFKLDGHAAQMILTLDNGSQNITVTSSAFMHNY